VKVKTIAFCALMMMATPASAQMWGPYGGYGPDAVAIHAMIAQLRANGLHPISQPFWSGSYVVIRAVDPLGDTVRVLFNARYGNLVSIAPLPRAPVVGGGSYPPYGAYPGRPYEPYPRYGALRPDLKVEPEASPDAQAPLPPDARYPGPNGPESRTATISPPRTPMPRPRPAMKTAPNATAAAKPAPDTAATVKPTPEVVEAPRAEQAPDTPATTGSVGAQNAPGSFPPPDTLE